MSGGETRMETSCNGSRSTQISMIVIRLRFILIIIFGRPDVGSSDRISLEQLISAGPWGAGSERFNSTHTRPSPHLIGRTSSRTCAAGPCAGLHRRASRRRLNRSHSAAGSWHTRSLGIRRRCWTCRAASTPPARYMQRQGRCRYPKSPNHDAVQARQLEARQPEARRLPLSL